MPPRLGACEDGLDVGDGVHIAHLGVKMQLDALFGRIVRAPLRDERHDVMRHDDAFAIKAIIPAVAAQAHRRADLQAFQQSVPALFIDIAFRRAGGFVVRDAELDLDPAAARLALGDFEDVALHDDRARAFVDLVDRHELLIGDLLPQKELRTVLFFAPLRLALSFLDDGARNGLEVRLAFDRRGRDQHPPRVFIAMGEPRG